MEREPEEVYKLPDLSLEEKGTFLKIHCPSCSAEAKVVDLNINDKIGKCEHCNVVFSFANSLPTARLELTPSDEIARPEGIDMIRFKDEMEMTLEQPVSVLDIIISCLAPLLIFIFLVMYFKEGKDWALIPGIISSLIFALSLFRLSSAKHRKIFLTLDKKYIYLQWRPKQLIKDKKIAFEDVEQLYVKTSTYGITLFLIVNGINGQRHEELLGGFRSLNKAKYVEQEMEKYLGIENKKVQGEL